MGKIVVGVWATLQGAVGSGPALTRPTAKMNTPNFVFANLADRMMRTHG